MTIRPRRLVFRGSVLASAYALDDEAHAHATVLSRWKPGHEVFAWGHRLVWRLPSPERVSCDAAPGLPLVETDRRLFGLPLERDELARAPAGILAAEGGALVARPLGASVDPSAWLDVSEFQFAASVEPLGDPPPPPQLHFEPRAATDARTALGMAPLPAEAVAVMESLRTGRPLETPPPPQQPITIGPIARGIVSGLRRLTRLFSRQTPGNDTALAPRQRPDWLQRLDAWLDRLLDASRISQVLGARQADYLNRLMEMFEKGDLDAALRHAIPLSNQPGPPGPRSLSVPSPRTNLDIPLGPRGAAGPAIVLDRYEELRRRYRAAVQKLEAEGRYQEAAFVLAELLQADEEAVALLERHKKFELAAELAEARQLPPGLQVRQWFLAKNTTRAVAVARRHGVFADAIIRLSRSKHDDEAKQLRLIWADTQANSGDFFNAVLTVWPLPDVRPLVRRWMDLGIAQGGHAAARLKVKRLAAGGGVEPEHVATVLEDLERDDPERAYERQLITQELEAESPHLAGIAKPLARAALRTALRDGTIHPAPRLAVLHRLSADGALKADMPAYPSPEVRLSVRAPPLRIDLEGWDKGVLAVHDAALLPDGRVLCALGEAGVRVLARDGRTAKHFDVPAERLVTYDHGGHALALARRGEVLVGAKLDLLSGAVQPVPQLNLVWPTETTDGSLWFVHDGEALSALDLHDERLRALWRVPTGRLLQSPVRTAHALSLHVAQGNHREWWSYELPSLTLRVRQEVHTPQVFEQAYVTGEGRALFTQGGVAWQQPAATQNRRQLTGLAGGAIHSVAGWAGWHSLVTRGEGSQRWQLVDVGYVTVRHVVQVPRSDYRVRVSDDVAVYCDHAGRVLVVDLVYGRLLRDLRVR